MDIVRYVHNKVNAIQTIAPDVARGLKSASQLQDTVKALLPLLDSVSKELGRNNNASSAAKIVDSLSSVDILLNEIQTLLLDQQRKLKQRTSTKWLWENSLILDNITRALAAKTERLRVSLEKKTVASSQSKIEDPAGWDFWTRYFGDASVLVPWPYFFEALEFSFQQYGIQIRDAEPFLKQAIDYTFDGTVSSFEMNAFLSWFGPFRQCVDKVSNLCKKSYFVGNCSRSSAQQWLESRDPGTFIVRWSSLPGQFAVSYMGKDNQLHHSLIYSLQDHMCTFDNKTFKPAFRTVPELISSHSHLFSRSARDVVQAMIDQESGLTAASQSYTTIVMGAHGPSVPSAPLPSIPMPAPSAPQAVPTNVQINYTAPTIAVTPQSNLLASNHPVQTFYTPDVMPSSPPTFSGRISPQSGRNSPQLVSRSASGGRISPVESAQPTGQSTPPALAIPPPLVNSNSLDRKSFNEALANRIAAQKAATLSVAPSVEPQNRNSFTSEYSSLSLRPDLTQQPQQPFVPRPPLSPKGLPPVAPRAADPARFREIVQQQQQPAVRQTDNYGGSVDGVYSKFSLTM